MIEVLYQIKYLQNKFDICHRQPAESSRFCAFKSKRGPQHLTAAAARLGPPQSPTPPWWPAAGWCRWRAAAAVPMWTSGRQPSVLCARGAAWGCWPLELCCAMLYAAADTKLLSRAHQLGLNHLHFYEKTYQRPLTPLGPGQVCMYVVLYKYVYTDLCEPRSRWKNNNKNDRFSPGLILCKSHKKRLLQHYRAMTSEATWWIRGT